MKKIGKKKPEDQDKKELELLASKKHPDRADILSVNPKEDTVKVRARKNGKETTKTLAIKIEKIKKQKKSIEEISSPSNQKRGTEKKPKEGEKNGKMAKRTKTKKK